MDISGDRYGSLLVIKAADTIEYGGKREPMWLCRCDCGNLTTVPQRRLRSRDATSIKNGFNVDRCEKCRSGGRIVRKNRPWREIITKAKADGLSIDRVAEAHGVNRRTVYDAEYRYGVKLTRTPTRTMADWRKIFQHAAQTKRSVANIARDLGVTPNHVYTIRRKLQSDQS